MGLTDALGLRWPIIQAPMAGVATPAMAAAVSRAGGLGSLGVGAAGVDGARVMVREAREAGAERLNVNVFCHAPAKADLDVDQAWLERMAPEFARFGAEPPEELREIYRSFLEDDAMLEVLLEARPEVVSFHFGLPDAKRIAALKAAGIRLFASATSVAEGQAVATAGVDAVVAQGIEAGGHRGMFDPEAEDEGLSALALTERLAGALNIPVITAGGMMNGGDIAVALAKGAEAAQLGTAFLACDESAADAAYRAALRSQGGYETRLTQVISGRPARCVANRFTAWGEANADLTVPAYPNCYDAGKALNAAAKAVGENGFGAQWAGTGAPHVREMAAGELLRHLGEELDAALAG